MQSSISTEEFIPGPASYPLIGWRGFVLEFAKDSIGYLEQLHNTYGDLVRINDGELSAYITFHADYTKQILSDPSIFYSYDLADMPFKLESIDSLGVLTTALALMNGERHKQQRRLMMPPFHNKALHTYTDEIINICEILLSKWEAGGTRDIYQDMEWLGIAWSTKIFIGMDPEKEGQYFGEKFEKTMQILFSPAALLLPYNIPGLPFRKLVQNTEEIQQDILDLINRRRAKGNFGQDALSTFIQTHDEDGTMMTDEELVGQTMALFRGGSKTNSSAMTWTLFLLAQHPEVCQRLLDELNEVLQGKLPTYEQLDQLPYLEGVIKESMRLIPPVIWGARYNIEDVMLGDVHIPAKTTVFYSEQIAHRDPDIFPEPDKFKPERWLEITPSIYEYYPFSAGPRMCLGAGFAMVALKIAVAIIMTRYRFTITPNAKIHREGLIGTLPKYGIPMEIAPQDGQFTKSKIRGNILNLVDLS